MFPMILTSVSRLLKVFTKYEEYLCSTLINLSMPLRGQMFVLFILFELSTTDVISYNSYNKIHETENKEIFISPELRVIKLKACCKNNFMIMLISVSQRCTCTVRQLTRDVLSKLLTCDKSRYNILMFI